MVKYHTMAVKTYTVGADTATDVELLRERLERLWQVRPSYAQVIRHAVSIALAKSQEDGQKDGH